MTGAVEGRLAAQWAKVRTLHKPVRDGQTLTATGYVSYFDCAECEPAWPCPTARIVFSEREIAAALAGTPPQTEDET